MKKYIVLFILQFIILFFLSLTNNSNDNCNSFIYPTKYTDISSNYGNRILYGNNNFHNGVDFLAPEGSEIYASCSGYVIHASFLENGYGNTIILSHDFGIKSLYCHVSEKFIVNVGDFINQGDLIAYVGPKYLSNGTLNGNTTGPHLHFSIFENNSPINPFDKLKK